MILGRSSASSVRMEIEVAAGLAAQQDNHFSNEFIYINRFALRFALLEQRADSANDISRARYVFNES